MNELNIYRAPITSRKQPPHNIELNSTIEHEKLGEKDMN